jgi:hypothetical protein
VRLSEGTAAALEEWTVEGDGPEEDWW